MGLLLRAVDVAGPLRWRWLLSDEVTGAPLADHPVDLRAEPNAVARFTDLYGYVRFYAVPDRRVEDGARFVAEAGAWAGTALLGEPVGNAIVTAAASGPVTVRVVAEPPADPVLLWPLELAHVVGKPLAARGDVSFVYDIPVMLNGQAAPGAFAGAGSGKAPVSDELRVLAVFSQPTQTSVLALRRERYALARLIRQLGRQRAKVTLHVAQYGVTRERLSEIAQDGDGWDMLHLSGHGAGGVFLLEMPDGSRDPVPTADLIGLLRPATRRLKLAVVSACESAADATAETYRLLGLTAQAEALEAEAVAATSAAEPAASDSAVGAQPGTGEASAAGQRLSADAELAAAGPSGPVSEPIAGEPAATGQSLSGQQATTNESAAGQPTRQPAVAAHIPGLARALVRDLGCPVIAMRYPVNDEFAIAFGDVLYKQLLSNRQPVDVAVARAVAAAVGPGTSAACPALSVATPGVFAAGVPAARLRFDVPRGRPAMDPAEQRMAFFPDEPPRFVGRAAPMAKASAALAPDSGRTGVLLHGMAGAGKTACALELAYRHQDSFAALAFWQAPTRDEEWASGLADFASRLDIQLADYGFTMTSHITTEATLKAFAPRLRSLMAEAGILLVLDNLETLLTPEGAWRDPRWSILIDALTGHDGESRVILTSRVAPAGLTAASASAGPPGALVGGTSPPGTASPRVVTLPVHSLSLDEAVALARELPSLRALLHADAGPLRDAAPAVDADRDRVRRVLRVVQGHPKLMELADAAASDRDRLDRQLAAAESAASSEGASAAQELDVFFRDGETTLDTEGFVAALGEWTRLALSALSPQARLMAESIACLEDPDRRSDVIESVWPSLWRSFQDPAAPGAEAAPAWDAMVRELGSAALVEAEVVLDAGPDGQSAAEDTAANASDGSALLVLRMHPGVAAAIASAAGPGLREAVDAGLAGFWRAVFDGARQRAGGEDSALVVRAGLAAAPYLLRRQDWGTASVLLEHAALRDSSPGLVQAVLPSLRRVAAATGAPVDAGVLGRVLMRVDAVEAERLLRGARDAAAGAGDYQVASAVAGVLFNLLRDAGRLREALAVAGQVPELTRLAGLGPWTQLADQAQRLQVLGRMGEHAQVLAGVDRLRAAMAGLPDRGGPDEAVNPWNVRETVLDIGHASALATGEWARCLELNAEVVASVRGRGAGVHEVTRFRFNDAAPLRELGRAGEAGRLLAECQRVFEDHADTTNLAKVLSGRASLEDSLGRPGAAADLGRAALRLRYARPELRDIMISHYNLASTLGRLAGERAGQRAHRLAAALICHLAGMAHDLAQAAGALADEMRGPGGADPSLPSTLAEMIAAAEQTEGVRLAAPLAALEPDESKVEAALSEILTAARSPA